MASLDSQKQASTSTSLNRHVKTLAKLKNHVTTQPRILSFGCSIGKELLDIASVFNDYIEIVGVDINQDALSEASVIGTTMRNVKVKHTRELHDDEKFDLIVCCNVLCSYKGVDKRQDPIEHSDFKETINNFAKMCNDKAVIVVIGANYLLYMQEFGRPVEFIEISKNSGPVPVYDNGGKLLTRENTCLHAVKFVMTQAVQQPVAAMFAVQRKLTIGVFCYRTSKNIGDYAQSLAQINIWSRFYRPSWNIQSPVLREAFEWLSSTKPDGETVRQRNYNCDVTVIWLERDSTHMQDVPTTGKVYVIANAWYMHKSNNRYQFPFASWVHPIFSSVHIAKQELLEQPGAVEYLRKYGPIGCRDTHTERLLLNLNIPSYFSGCLTFTLEAPQEMSMDQARRFKNDIYKQHLFMDDESGSFSHTMPCMLEETYDQHLTRALDMYKQYMHAESVQTTRIHTAMPSSAIGAKNVWFSSPASGNQSSWNERSRFKGLIDLMQNPAKREIMAFALAERLTEVVDRLLVDGVVGDDLVQIYRGKNLTSIGSIGECLNISNRKLPFEWSSFRKMHFSKLICESGGVVDGALAHNTQFYFHREMVGSTAHFSFRNVPIERFEEKMDIVLTFDDNFVKIVKPFLSNLSRTNPTTLFRTFCITRNIDEAVFARLCSDTMRLTNLVMFNIPTTYDFSKYQTSLKHVSVSCLDRLLIPIIKYPVEDVVNRVIYLDLDMLVTGDISALNHVETGVTGICAKSSKVPRVIQGWLRKSKSSLTYTSKKSFNFGVAVIDIHKLRLMNFFNEAMSIYNQGNGVNDQIVANIYCKGKYAELPGKYNIFVGQDDNEYSLTPGLLNTGAIWHFAGSCKPWLSSTESEYKYNNELWKLWQNSCTCYDTLEDVNGHFVAA